MSAKIIPFPRRHCRPLTAAVLAGRDYAPWPSLGLFGGYVLAEPVPAPVKNDTVSYLPTSPVPPQPTLEQMLQDEGFLDWLAAIAQLAGRCGPKPRIH